MHFNENLKQLLTSQQVSHIVNPLSWPHWTHFLGQFRPSGHTFDLDGKSKGDGSIIAWWPHNKMVLGSVPGSAFVFLISYEM